MKQHPEFLVLICLMSFFSLVNCSSKSNDNKSDTEPLGPNVALQLVTKGLESPVEMAIPDDGTNRIFIVEQKGRIMVLDNGTLLSEPFLDVSAKMVEMNAQYTERGLLGMAFHPQYKTNGRFFIYYSAPSSQSGSDHKSILGEYKVSTNPNKAETVEKVIMEIEQPQANHNGGHLEFGPGGYLYIGLGDGGGAGDQHGPIGNAQSLANLLGKIIRINVNSGNPYSIPADNPFVGQNNVRTEIWAYGLRNPWKFTFDKNGRIFCADVGQNAYEEVNIIEKGKNYGWRIMEGSHCYNPALNCNTAGLTMPIYEYDHNTGVSITGGYFYDGTKVPAFKNKYVFADWTGVFFAITTNGSGGKITVKNAPSNLRVLSFGKDKANELYVLTSLDTQPLSPTGAIYKLIASQ
ncbi:PQQ-dependent sugar dehydrogenase [Solitalea lacus]|uniref:PQQ-dependent sugar dehydrogenase n=1 Tax=Solitalea lacus TaxID=2911172 RepID=UPI001EDBB4A1|nr:PQQ-dependent sugar dehydrogenase [Solitalea lacus]UKJ08152.1 PQQ-dependent sugar dehydrogenase [Solitalea lacus]